MNARFDQCQNTQRKPTTLEFVNKPRKQYAHWSCINIDRSYNFSRRLQRFQTVQFPLHYYINETNLSRNRSANVHTYVCRVDAKAVTFSQTKRTVEWFAIVVDINYGNVWLGLFRPHHNEVWSSYLSAGWILVCFSGLPRPSVLSSLCATSSPHTLYHSDSAKARYFSRDVSESLFKIECSIAFPYSI